MYEDFDFLYENNFEEQDLEQEFYATLVPGMADLAAEYLTASPHRRIQIMSIFVKEMVVNQLDGSFQRDLQQMIKDGNITKDGKITFNTK